MSATATTLQPARLAPSAKRMGNVPLPAISPMESAPLLTLLCSLMACVAAG